MNCIPEVLDKGKTTGGSKSNRLDDLRASAPSRVVTSPTPAPTLQKQSTPIVITAKSQFTLKHDNIPQPRFHLRHNEPSDTESPQTMRAEVEADPAAYEIPKVTESTGIDRKLSKRARPPNRSHDAPSKCKLTKVYT
ncbi:hypothetical protein ACMFMF_004842 [Clarireedia jacksonii]